ncbi:delta subunit of the central stalk of mitochondrial F1F0 ATP synthase, atp16 [Vermiconidia calcicola]|uniref:Delta subunit of the central stalk of mitochondrial F1F0 ATP synthase, atp16 n=1 Tax=Vermiconidia calcicola TaxID=1690605 RepID=A0ACC3NQB8_9PEZI|nr:delta subunit of the central stalk of mitochondrial F1F0 ATP synthase, atp16 [Vermiconidia calcicola]
MNSVRVARAALRARPTAMRAPLQRRSYADVAADKIQLSLALPHQAIYKSQDVYVPIPPNEAENDERKNDEY